MSESAIPETSTGRSRFAGILPLVIASLVMIIYLRNPLLSSTWSESARYFFYFIESLVVVMGCVKLIGNRVRRPMAPSWIRLTQHWMTIPLEGWIYLGIMFVLFTGAMLTKQNTLLLVFALMAGPFIINGQMTFGMLQAVALDRQAPKRAMQGELFPVEVALANRRPFFALWMMTVRDEVFRSEENLDAVILFTRVAPRTAQTGIYELRLSHRGRYQLGPMRVASRFPLGLVERSRLISLPGEIFVYPRLGRISPSWRMKLSGATELVSQSQPQRGVFHDDFHSLREFRPGDNPRAIHWRSTARRGEMILREFHQNREHTLSVVLDLHRSPGIKSADVGVVELALSFVASLLTERGRECRDGFLSLAASGQQTFRWEGQGHGGSLELLFDGLALFEAGPANDVADLLKHALQHASPATQILIVSTRVSAPPYQSLLSSRTDVLKVPGIPAEDLLIFEQGTRYHRKHPELLLEGTPAGV